MLTDFPTSNVPTETASPQKTTNHVLQATPLGLLAYLKRLNNKKKNKDKKALKEVTLLEIFQLRTILKRGPLRLQSRKEGGFQHSLFLAHCITKTTFFRADIFSTRVTHAPPGQEKNHGNFKEMILSNVLSRRPGRQFVFPHTCCRVCLDLSQRTQEDWRNKKQSTKRKGKENNNKEMNRAAKKSGHQNLANT